MAIVCILYYYSENSINWIVNWTIVRVCSFEYTRAMCIYTYIYTYTSNISIVSLDYSILQFSSAARSSTNGYKNSVILYIYISLPLSALIQFDIYISRGSRVKASYCQ